jgi:predicted amidohydrolase
MLRTGVTVVQFNARIFASVEEYAGAVRRFIEFAQTKEVKLIVFPELVGLLLIPALMAGLRPSLVRAAGRRREHGVSALERLRGAVAGSVAGALRADVRREAERWLLQPDNATALERAYSDIFSRAALDHRITIAGGTSYRADPSGSTWYNTAYVFGPDGSLLGQQDQIHLSAASLAELCAGEAWAGIETPFGRLGLLIGADVLFPETARILAYQGIDILVHLAACPGNLPAAKMRHAFEARVAENEVFGLQSFLVGRNPWAAKEEQEELLGRSVICGPMELVPRPHGVLAEMGQPVEGALMGLLDLPELHRWWSTGASSLRRTMRPGLYAGYLADLYRSGQTLQGVYEAGRVAQAAGESLPAPGETTPPMSPATVPWEQIVPQRDWREGDVPPAEANTTASASVEPGVADDSPEIKGGEAPSAESKTGQAVEGDDDLSSDEEQRLRLWD